MRKLTPLVVAFVVLAVPALGADQTVNAAGTIEGYKWQPISVEVFVGEKVTWTNGSNTGHNLDFENAAIADANSGGTATFPVQRTFNVAPGTYAYRCTLHSPNFVQGMIGQVVVKEAPATPTPTTTPGPGVTPTPTPSPSTTPGAGATPTPTPAGTAPRFLRARTFVRRGGARLAMQLSRPGRVDADVFRAAPGSKRYRRFGTLRYSLTLLHKEFRLVRTREFRPFRSGRYRLELKTGPGTSPDRRTLRFRLP